MSKFQDNRGLTITAFKNVNSKISLNQCNISINNKNVFRGIYYENYDRLITCIQGKILNISVNLDRSSENYLETKYTQLDPNSSDFQILIPEKYGNAFLVLEDNSIVVSHSDNTNNMSKIINYLDPNINLKLPIIKSNIILSNQDKNSEFIENIDYLILGHTGYIGSKIYRNMLKCNKKILYLVNRLDDHDGIYKNLSFYKPKYLINAAGLTHWNENDIEKIETNITHKLMLIKICNELNIHLTMIGDGGIFSGQKIFSENDRGNNLENFHKESTIYFENLLRKYQNVLYLRINKPISYDNHIKNLIIELSSQDKIFNIETSVTCLDTLVPLIPNIIESNQIGIFNFVNPGNIKLSDIRKVFDKIMSIDKQYEIIENESKCLLNTKKIEKFNPPNIYQSVVYCVQNLKKLKIDKWDNINFLFNKYDFHIRDPFAPIEYTLVSQSNVEKKLIAIIHCYNIDNFEDIFGDYIDDLIEFFDIIVTYSKGISVPEYNINLIKVKNMGRDIGGYMCGLKYILDRNIEYSHILFLHSKTNKDDRLQYFNPLIGSNEIIQRNIELLEKYDVILHNVFHDSNLEKQYIGDKIYHKEMLTYLGVKNKSHLEFSEGNCMIFCKELVDFIFVENLNIFYNILNTNYDFDINWVRLRYPNKNRSNKEYYRDFVNESDYMDINSKGKSICNNFGNDSNFFDISDGMIEHVFERIYINVIEHLNLKYIICD